MKNENVMSELNRLLRTERPDLLRYASYKLGNVDDAEDAIQDSYLNVYSKIKTNDASGIENMRCYFFRTLSNICNTRAAKQSKITAVSIDECDLPDESTDDFQEEYNRISLLLSQLPDEQAEVIRLRMYGGNSFAQIAGILSVPLPTVKSRFLYGLEKIRKGFKMNY